jgi:D-3-phosphoglycerate dehydrogenase / 2-oxoglutarate reductase
VRIVATADVPPVAREAFARLGEIEVAVAGDGRAFADAEILIVRGTRLDADLLARAGRLRAIARTGAGYDNVDVETATRLGVPVIYAPGIGSRPVAEGTLALILAAAKRLRELGAVVHENGWAGRYGVVGLDIDGACLGVVGFGAIGREVARLCSAVGMTVIAHDPVSDRVCPHDAELVPLAELVERADVISLHCALTERTRGLVDGRFLAGVKKGAIIVNASRGEVVASEDVLADALVAGRISAVALDVFPTEPPPAEHRLYADPRVICTPHTVGLTPRWNEEVFRALADGVESVLAGRRAENLLNPEALSAASSRPAAGSRGYRAFRSGRAS